MISCAANMINRLLTGSYLAAPPGFALYRLRVFHTAGSGKSQAALAEYSAAFDAGLHPLYVCFDWMVGGHIDLLDVQFKRWMNTGVPGPP